MAGTYDERGRTERQLAALNGILLVDPRNVDARVRLAEIYDRNENYIWALREYNNILKIDPVNETALEKVAVLETLVD